MMAQHVPIAIACNQDCPGKTPITGVYETYPQAVAAGGGLPVILSETEMQECLDRYLDMVGGLLVPGGIDVSPLLYGRSPDVNLGELDPALDNYQIALIRRAHGRGMPILGICRGLQVLTVALGGTLIQHLPADARRIGHLQKMPGRWPSHHAAAEKGSLIEELFGREFAVNSFHHQAVEMPAPGFKVTAKAPDGVIEAVEAEDGPWTVGVQWHPERMIHDDPAALNLFRRFVKEASAYLDSRRS